MKQELSAAIEDYLRWRKSQDIKPSTLNNQKGVLKRFLATSGNIYVHQIGTHAVTRYFEKASLTRQPQTLRVDHVTLSVFFDWCRHTKRMSIDNDPMYGRRTPRGVKRERNRLNVTQFPVLLDAAGRRCARDRAAVAVIMYTLLRDSEVGDLRVGDVDLEGGWLRARIFKTGQEDRMPISEELDGELRQWLTAYTREVGHLEPNYRLIPARWIEAAEHDANGRFTAVKKSVLKPTKPIGPLGRIVNPILEDIGFPVVDHNGKPCGEGAHTIRRSGARALFDSLVGNGYDGALRIVQSMLHHASITQTEGYIGVTADRRTRDEVLRGQRMYAALSDGGNVVPLAQ